jgi:hypothetical protein
VTKRPLEEIRWPSVQLSGRQLTDGPPERFVGAIGMSFLPNDQCDSTEISYGCRYQAPGYELTEKNDAPQGRNDRNTELHSSGVDRFQRRYGR